MAAPRCVLVDDDPDFISFVLLFLRRFFPHFEVSAFSSAPEALDFLGAQAADLMITDFKMPRMDGLELVGRVRASERKKSLRIVVMSGETVEAEALARGADAFVAKRDLFARLPEVVARLGFGGARPRPE